MNTQVRNVSKIIEPQVVYDGAGVKIRRSIATRVLDYLDPFLLFDHFGSDNPQDYLAGFPMHPHRGIETVTYMLAGIVRHGDSIGNSGEIGPGDVQWMTAGGGILHEEMPRPGDSDAMFGFQLWVNLPAQYKMTRPRYQEIPSASIPEVTRDEGVKIRVIAGNVDGVQGPVTEIVADPTYLDVSLSPGASIVQPIPRGHTGFSYAYEGEGVFGQNSYDSSDPVSALSLVIFGDGDFVKICTVSQPLRFLLISGKPIHEPIARYGPFVMNTQAEIEQALRDLRNGTFVMR